MMNELCVRDTVEGSTRGLLSLTDRRNLRKFSFIITFIPTKILNGYFRKQVWAVASWAVFSASVSCSATLPIVLPTYRRVPLWRLLVGLFAPCSMQSTFSGSVQTMSSIVIEYYICMRLCVRTNLLFPLCLQAQFLFACKLVMPIFSRVLPSVSDYRVDLL
jgi:hypothetical protein